MRFLCGSLFMCEVLILFVIISIWESRLASTHKLMTASLKIKLIKYGVMCSKCCAHSKIKFSWYNYWRAFPLKGKTEMHASYHAFANCLHAGISLAPWSNLPFFMQPWRKATRGEMSSTSRGFGFYSKSSLEKKSLWTISYFIPFL